VTFAWNNLALAGLRDLTATAPATVYTPFIQAGFYLPPESTAPRHTALLAEQGGADAQLLRRRFHRLRVFAAARRRHRSKHSTHADKFVYEPSWRTGVGRITAMPSTWSAALREFFRQVPRPRLGDRRDGRA